MMLKSIEWLIEGRVLKIEMLGELTLELLIEIIDAIKQKMVDAKPPFVNIFIDLSNRTSVHRSIFSVSEISKHVEHNEMSGWVLVIDPNSTAGLRFLGTMVSQLARQRFRIVSSMQEGIEFLKTVDTTMVDLL